MSRTRMERRRARRDWAVRLSLVLAAAVLLVLWRMGDAPAPDGETARYAARQEAVAVYDRAVETRGDREAARAVAVRTYEEALGWNIS